MLVDERATTAIAFLKRALGFYAAHGIRVERVTRFISYWERADAFEALGLPAGG